MRYLVSCTILVTLVTAALVTPVHAQSRSRMDIQLAAWFIDTHPGFRPGLLMGATGWLSDRSGIAVRGFVVPGWYSRWESTWPWGNERGIEVMYRYRGHVGNFETDFGIGLEFSTIDRGRWTQDGSLVRERLNWARWYTWDFLVGRRVHERFGLKGGVGSRFVNVKYASHILKLVVVVPLGSLGQSQ